MASKCLICHSTIIQPLTIRSYFMKTSCACDDCLSGFVYESCSRCNHCHKRLAQDELECTDCHFINQHFEPVEKITCLYDYNDAMKSLIHAYKSNKDIALKEVFAQMIKGKIGKYDAIIPIPSSEERLNERGFDHIECILDAAKIKYSPILKTHFRPKQSQLTKKERLHEHNPYYMEVDCPANILLIDDIYTTGLTIHRASRVLNSKNAKSIEVLTFARA